MVSGGGISVAIAMGKMDHCISLFGRMGSKRNSLACMALFICGDEYLHNYINPTTNNIRFNTMDEQIFMTVEL
jgi:hypothetical protein